MPLNYNLRNSVFETTRYIERERRMALHVLAKVTREAGQSHTFTAQGSTRFLAIKGFFIAENPPIPLSESSTFLASTCIVICKAESQTGWVSKGLDFTWFALPQWQVFHVCLFPLLRVDRDVSRYVDLDAPPPGLAVVLQYQ